MSTSSKYFLKNLYRQDAGKEKLVGFYLPLTLYYMYTSCILDVDTIWGEQKKDYPEAVYMRFQDGMTFVNTFLNN